MMRIAHLADLHLGTVADGSAARPETADESPFARAAAGILTAGIAGIVIAGDVFDRSIRDDGPVEAFLCALHDWNDAGIPVALIAGNHDAENGLLARLPLPSSTHLFSAEHPETIAWEALGIAVHGQSIGEADESRDLAASFPPPRAGMRNIGVLHTSLDSRWGGRICAPTSLETLQTHGYDYWALGHVHRRHVFDSEPSIAYAGSVYGRPSDPAALGDLEVRFSEGPIVVRTRTMRPVDG